MTETERRLIDNLERHRAGDAATANLIADAAKTLRRVTEDRDLWRTSEGICSKHHDRVLARLYATTVERNKLRKHADALAGVCETFLGRDNRFQIAVGGNPIAVDAMLDASRSTLAAYTAYLIDGGNDA